MPFTCCGTQSSLLHGIKFTCKFHCNSFGIFARKTQRNSVIVWTLQTFTLASAVVTVCYIHAVTRTWQKYKHLPVRALNHVCAHLVSRISALEKKCFCVPISPQFVGFQNVSFQHLFIKLLEKLGSGLLIIRGNSIFFPFWMCSVNATDPVSFTTRFGNSFVL